MAAPGDTPARAVLWDLGRTLVDWDPRRLYAKLLPDDDAVEAFLRGVCTLDWHQAHDAGTPMAENQAALKARFPEHADLVEAWRTRWDEMFDGWIEGMEAIVTELEARGVAQYGLTNLPAEKWPHIAKTYPAIARFRDVIVSGAEGVVKPDPAIYAITTARIDHGPAETVFFDDSSANVTAARQAGFQAELFEGADAVRERLERAGLL